MTSPTELFLVNVVSTHYDGGVRFQGLDVSLHLVEPARLEGVEVAVDEDDHLGQVRPGVQDPEAAVGDVVGQECRNEVALDSRR